MSVYVCIYIYIYLWVAVWKFEFCWNASAQLCLRFTVSARMLAGFSRFHMRESERDRERERETRRERGLIVLDEDSRSLPPACLI